MVVESVLCVKVDGIGKTGKRVAVEFTLIGRKHVHIVMKYLPP